MEKVTTVANRLSEIMKLKNLRQVDIIEKAQPFCEQYNVGLNKSDLSQYVKGKVAPGTRKLKVLALALNVSEPWLLGYDVPMERTAPESDICPPSDSIPYNPTHRIPILGRISAGLPLYADEHIEGYTYTELNHGQEYFALRVHGDSMNALHILDGYLVIVRRQDYAENGDIAVVIVGDDEATMKRFYQSGDTVTLMPQSTNPEHLPQIYNLKETQIHIIGKVVKVEFNV